MKKSIRKKKMTLGDLAKIIKETFAKVNITNKSAI
jgi:hypothetical protein